MQLKFFENATSLYYDLEKSEFSTCTREEFMKYLRTRYTNLERFKSNFVKPYKELLDQFEEMESEENIGFKKGALKLVDGFVEDYSNFEPFTYKEAFNITNDEFRALIFGSIRVPDMIKELGHERIKVAGQPVKHKKFDSEGNFIGMEEYDVIYETHKVNGENLGIGDDLCAVKCWCTTTEEEHWLWVDEKYINDPLEAIASTFMIHKNLIPYIKELKRQGDVLLVELTEDVEPDPEAEQVSLTKEQYFSLLTAQS